jgi:hypothetical protein
MATTGDGLKTFVSVPRHTFSSPPPHTHWRASTALSDTAAHNWLGAAGASGCNRNRSVKPPGSLLPAAPVQAAYIASFQSGLHRQRRSTPANKHLGISRHSNATYAIPDRQRCRIVMAIMRHTRSMQTWVCCTVTQPAVVDRPSAVGANAVAPPPSLGY